jgi:hypothetical protein
MSAAAPEIRLNIVPCLRRSDRSSPGSRPDESRTRDR